MYANVKKYKVIILLLPLVLSMQINVYGQLPKDRSQNIAEQSDHGYSSLNHTLKLLMQKNSANGQLRQKNTLPSSEFGRENPFMPLIVKPADGSVQTDHKSDSSHAEPKIRLTAVFIANGSQRNKPTAIIEEKGVSRSVYIGDIVAGMKIVAIRRGEVILDKDNKSYTMKLGILPQATTKYKS